MKSPAFYAEYYIIFQRGCKVIFENLFICNYSVLSIKIISLVYWLSAKNPRKYIRIFYLILQIKEMFFYTRNKLVSFVFCIAIFEG